MAPFVSAINSNEDVLTLTLGDDASIQHRLYRLSKGSRVRFMPAACLRGRSIKLEINYPFNKKNFDRLDFTTLHFGVDPTSPNSDPYTDLFFELAGTFDFRYTVEPSDNSILGISKQRKADEGPKQPNKFQGHIIVESEIMLGSRRLTLDNLSIMTMIPPAMGPSENWLNQFQLASDTEFSAVHLCPIQARSPPPFKRKKKKKIVPLRAATEQGGSNSCYSLKNQLRLNPKLFGEDPDKADAKLAEIVAQANKPRDEGGLGLVLIMDVVYNHTSPDSEWLNDHPEAGFNLVNSAFLRAPFVLDRAIALMSKQIGDGTLDLPRRVQSQEDVTRLIDHLEYQILPRLDLKSFYLVQEDDAVAAFREFLISNPKPAIVEGNEPLFCQSHLARNSIVDMDVALHRSSYLVHRNAQWACAWLRNEIKNYNGALDHELDADLGSAMGSLRGTMAYERLDPTGPCLGDIDEQHPLFSPYFTILAKGRKQDTYDYSPELLEAFDLEHCLVNNGWLFGGDPSTDFVHPTSRAYLRHDVVIWGDCVKMRYGSGPKDSPWLWEHMAEYTRRVCKNFHGVRIDNCHSTPRHVGQYMMDIGRTVRPDLLVVAELFTNSAETDAAFTNQLGISTLIGESMTPGNSRDYSTHLHRLAGQPTGSFTAMSHRPLEVAQQSPRHVFYDASHDTEYPGRRYTLEHSLPLMALNALISNGTGTTRGFDELWPDKMNVVADPRKYRPWTGNNKPKSDDEVGISTGLYRFRRVLNQLHHRLTDEHYDQAYVDLKSNDIITVTRHCLKTLQEVTVVARLAFSGDNLGDESAELHLEAPGRVKRVILAARPIAAAKPAGDLQSSKWSYGHSLEYEDFLNVEPKECPNLDITSHETGDRLRVSKFRPGAVLVYTVEPLPAMLNAVTTIENILKQPNHPVEMTAVDLNHALFRCNQEEETEEGKQDGVYYIPNYGPLKFVGLLGLIPLLDEIVASNNLGHPLCDNLRAGPWLLKFLAQHLAKRNSCKPLASILWDAAKVYMDLPIGRRPWAFSQVVSYVYNIVYNYATGRLMSDQAGQCRFVELLTLSSVQLYGLDARRTLDKASLEQDSAQLSMAAGLPHFAAGWMRSWGRDTFIALRGLLMVTKNYEGAKLLILRYAAVVRHGLIPNLFDGGRNPRYNCRDATWWWLQAIKDYCTLVPFGEDILFEVVERDDPREFEESGTVSMPLCLIMHEVLQKHLHGIEFREWNAGPDIDRDMSPEGFDIAIHVDRETGFIHGGSRWNCGTWMDKMGSSERAGNKGHPATPRDGAAVEIQGLAYSVLSWLAAMPKCPLQPLHTESVGSGEKTWTFEHWADLLKANFSKHFYVPRMDAGDYDSYVVNEELVNRRGIFKDTVGSSAEYTDYQLRPNFPVALAVAPELVSDAHALSALRLAEEVLLGPLGMRTLDPSDWKYRPNYDNSNDTDDYQVAKGFNYHQGPEWLWPIGYFCRAILNFADNKQDTIHRINQFFARHEEHLAHSHWVGLPELCNENGSFCADSCPTQAWSAAAVLDVLYDANMLSNPIQQKSPRRSSSFRAFRLSSV